MKTEKKIIEISNNITAPEGFLSAGMNCGLRKNKPDIALIFSPFSSMAVGAFTKNVVKAAPVIYSMNAIKNPINAIIINSANANACTGERGIKDAQKMAKLTAKYLHLKSDNVLVFSTGVIGEYLNMKKIKYGIKSLSDIIIKKRGNSLASASILTTDTSIKEVAVKFDIEGVEVKIGAIAKGSGMIAPSMATMLAFITSDVNIEKKILKKLFYNAVENSFNKITIDGEMSTNDSVVFLTNFQAKNKKITKATKTAIDIFYFNLLYVMQKLATLIVQDGEGATKFIKIKVTGLKTRKDAKIIAFKIANSLLVKTAMYGGDPNWGRIIATAGASGINFNSDNVIIKLGKHVVFKGMPVKYNEKKVKEFLSNKEINIEIKFKEGNSFYEVFTTDLSEKYIKINSSYRT